MAWDDYARTDLAADKALPTTRAKWLRDRSKLAFQTPKEVYFSVQSTTSTNFATLASFVPKLPEFANSYVTIHFRPKVNGEGEIRLTTATDTGSAVAFNFGSLTELGSDVELALTAGQGVATTVNVQIKDTAATGGTVQVENVDRQTLWFEVP